VSCSRKTIEELQTSSTAYRNDDDRGATGTIVAGCYASVVHRGSLYPPTNSRAIAVYRLLVQEGGWSPDEYEPWPSQTVVDALVAR
jgi:hypothetical protein